MTAPLQRGKTFRFPSFSKEVARRAGGFYCSLLLNPHPAILRGALPHCGINFTKGQKFQILLLLYKEAKVFLNFLPFLKGKRRSRGDFYTFTLKNPHPAILRGALPHCGINFTKGQKFQILLLLYKEAKVFLNFLPFLKGKRRSRGDFYTFTLKNPHPDKSGSPFHKGAHS